MNNYHVQAESIIYLYYFINLGIGQKIFKIANNIFNKLLCMIFNYFIFALIRTGTRIIANKRNNLQELVALLGAQVIQLGAQVIL